MQILLLYMLAYIQAFYIVYGNKWAAPECDSSHTKLKKMNYSFCITIQEVHGVYGPLHSWGNYITVIQSQVKTEFQWTGKWIACLD